MNVLRGRIKYDENDFNSVEMLIEFIGHSHDLQLINFQ